jgi:hypothetical protein
MKVNISATEITEHTEIEKEMVFYSVTSVYSVANFHSQHHE